MPARDYQTACRDAVLSAWGESPWWNAEGETFRSVLVNLATSAGKTYTSGLIIDAVRDRGKCLFLADTAELCAQPRDAFWHQFKIQAGLEKAGARASIMADVVVGSAQTFQRDDRLHRYPPNHFSYVFVDEAHRGSDRNKKITDHFSAAKVMGMTATAFRAKLADLKDYFEHVAFEMGVFDLINEGYIAPLKVLTLPVKVDISRVHQKNGDYDEHELDTTIAPYYEEICRMILEHAEHRQIVAFLPLIKSSQEFVTIARSMGIDARHIDGKSEDRRYLLEQFAKGQFQLLSNSSLLTTGWDCPRCDCLLNLAPTRSAGLFRQKVGRIGRILPNVIEGVKDGERFVLATKEERIAAIAASQKPDALILDLLWQTEKFNLQGPSDLIATNEQERAAIQQQLAGLRSAGDLQAVTAEVQEAHEQRLKAALLAAAKRRSQFNDAINLVATMLHGRHVTSYEPVMKWHSKPVSQEQKNWLEKNGIDPESGTDRGHVSAFMNLIFGRKKAGLCSHRAVEALEKVGVVGAISMTKVQAFEILGGNYPISFGKHSRQATPLRAIPVGYWEWCMKADQRRWFNMGTYPIEFGWAKHVIEPEESRCTCMGKYQAPNCPQHPRAPEAPVGAVSTEFDDDDIPF